MSDKKVKVYFNSACPVCNAGIKGQKAKMAACQIEAEWIDIHAHPGVTDQIGAEPEFVRERLHVVNEQGEVKVGADAFAVLWSKTPGQRVLGRLVHLPVIRVIAQWAYNVFARLLYAWNKSKKRW